MVGCASGLQHEHILAAHMLQDLDHHFAVGEAAHRGTAKMDVEMLRYVFGELGIGITGEDHHVAGHGHLAKLKWARTPIKT